MVVLTSWNMKQLDLLADVEDSDVVLIQEGTAALRQSAAWDVYPAEGDWSTGGSPWRTAIAVRRGSGVTAEPLQLLDLHNVVDGALGVSRSGTITAVRLSGPGFQPFVAVSAYARWEYAHGGSLIYADANAHRILSDISVLLNGRSDAPDVLLAGDWNLLYGYNEAGWPDVWKQRYDTFFARASVLGLTYLGPRAPQGRQASPWPEELPTESSCVPTFHSNRQTPATATRQLDHVFATSGLAARTTVAALNGIEDWGRSDHCRIRIEISPDADIRH